jgi:hypothetical protein
LKQKRKTQAKKLTKPGTPITDLFTLSFPFEGEMGEKTASILKFLQYQPIHRDQIIL